MYDVTEGVINNIARSKSNQAIKFGQLVEYKKRKI